MRTCSVDGCDQVHSGLGYCRMHYMRMRNRGTTDDLPASVLTYGGLHQKLRNTLGPASGYHCSDCMGDARHWAYNHEDPDPEELYDQKTGAVYSLDLTRYIPLCGPCHTAFDIKFPPHCPQGHLFTPDTTFYRKPPRGERECRICQRARSRAWREKRRAGNA